MEKEIDDSIKELITRHLAGEASTEEEQKLFAWLKREQANEDFYRQFKKVFDASNDHYRSKPQPAIDVEHEWKKFRENVGERDNVRSLSPSYWLRIAASVLVLAVAGGILYYFTSKDNELHYLAGAKPLTVELKDGSVVVLNRNSELTVDDDYDDEKRAVTLKGEAFFNVRRSPKKSFIIHAKDAQVEVLGTSFSVQAYDSVENIEVIVETGIVKLSHANRTDGVQLIAGQRGTVDKTKAITQQANADVNYQSWNTQRLVFQESRLSEVIQTLNKTYGVNIELQGIPSDSCLLTVSFDHQTLDAVLNVLESTLNVSVIREGNRIEIIAEGC